MRVSCEYEYESAKMSKSFEYTNITKTGLAKLESQWRSDDPDPNNPFRLKWMEKVKKKEINVNKPRSNKEEKELKQKIAEEVHAEWEKANKEGTAKTTPLRSVRRGVADQESMDVTSGEPGTPMNQDEELNKKRHRTPEEEEASKRYKHEKEVEELKVRLAYAEGRIMELEKNQEKLERENARLRECEIKLGQWQTKVEERDHDIDKLERTIDELKQEAITGSFRVNELEITISQTESRRQETEEKLQRQEEEIRTLYAENGRLKQAKEPARESAVPAVSFADMLKKDTKIPEKTRIIETNKRKTKPTILIRPKQGETLKDTRMRITRTIQRNDQINFQMIQTKTALILQMASTQDEEKLLNHPNMKNNFDMSNRSEKKNPLMIIYGIPTEMKEAEVIEELLVRNLQSITDEQRQLIKPRFKTGPRNQDRYHLVFEVPRQVRQILLQNPKVYIGYEVTNVKDYLVVTTCLKCFDYGHIANYCKNDPRCGTCGEKGHKKSECRDKEKKVCLPCYQRGKKCGGKQEDCPQYKLSLQRTIDKFDYGP